MLCLSNSSLSNTMIEGALVADCRRMMMNKTMMNSIGEWRVGQTQHGVAKSMRNFMHSGAVMTEGIHFEYTIWASIILRYEPNLVLGWVVVELMSVQSIEEDLWISMGTTTIFEKGGGLIAVTGMMQIIAVIVNNVAIWTIIVVMYIINTMIEGALVADCHRMMMNKTMMNSIGEWRVGQTHHGAAKSTSRAPFSKVTMIYMTTIIVQIATLLTMTAIICIIPVTAISPPPFSKIVLVPM